YQQSKPWSLEQGKKKKARGLRGDDDGVWFRTLIYRTGMIAYDSAVSLPAASTFKQEAPLMTTTIRQAGPDDAATLAQIGAEAFTTAYAADLPLERLAAFAAETFAEARVAADLAEQPGCYLLLEVEGEAAGLAQLRDGPPPRGVTGPRPVELSKIYLLEKWIGRGLGTALMQASVDEARRRGYATL